MGHGCGARRESTELAAGQVHDSSSTTELSGPRVEPRVGDLERDAVAAELAEQAALGRLTVAEHSERVLAALSARTRADLSPLLADLPPAPSQLLAARERAARRRRAAAVAVLVPWLLVCSGLWLLWWMLGSDNSWWPVWPTLGWGVPTLVTAHGLLRAPSATQPGAGSTTVRTAAPAG